MKKITAELRTLVHERGSHLTDIHGIGPVVAARILADVGDVARFADRNRFASWTGTAPLDASSGENDRHRLSRAEVFRVLRPGGRAVLNIGERVPAGTQTHRILNDSGWVWAEEDVRRMVEQAGFADVTIQYVPWGEDTAVNRLFATVVGKVVGPIGGDLRLARGIKP